jgi:AraC-like DNA-binding protein
MYRSFHTSSAGESLRDRQSFWHAAIKSVIYEVDMEFNDSPSFEGLTECCEFGAVQLTRVKSAAVRYRRHDRHCDGLDPQILVCMPVVGEVELDQLGRRTRSEPGQFMLEYSDTPYQFQYGGECDMWALRIPEVMLRARTRSPSRFCSLNFDAGTGVGRLFSDYVKAVAQSGHLPSNTVQTMVGVQLTDLLAAVLEGDARVLQSAGSSVKNAHLARIEQYLRRNLADPELSAETVAAACGISLRYLHLVFKDTGQTLAHWVREQRLHLAHEALARASARISIAQIAYQHGFNDHAQFSSAFRKKYGCSPSEVLGQGGAIRS